LIEGQRADYSTVAAYWKFLTLIRWTITTSILIFLKDHNEFQILLLLIISVVYSILLMNGKPFESNFENKMSLFTEIMVSIYLYLLLCLTDFMPNLSFIRDPLALALVSVIGFAVFINLLVFVKYIINRIKTYIEDRARAKKYIV
jgi:CBS domain containing-hemolysin-like protein